MYVYISCVISYFVVGVLGKLLQVILLKQRKNIKQQ